MNKNSRWIFLLSLAVLAGCIAMSSAPKSSSRKWRRSPKALTNIEKVQPGMTSSEVAGIMGERIHIGYSKSAALEGAYEEIFIRNPYKEEVLSGGGLKYRVVYYFTNIERADGVVTDNELSPFVFEADRLVGKGWDFLAEFKNKLK